MYGDEVDARAVPTSAAALPLDEVDARAAPTSAAALPLDEVDARAVPTSAAALPLDEVDARAAAGSFHPPRPPVVVLCGLAFDDNRADVNGAPAKLRPLGMMPHKSRLDRGRYFRAA